MWSTAVVAINFGILVLDGAGTVEEVTPAVVNIKLRVGAEFVVVMSGQSGSNDSNELLKLKAAPAA